MAHTRQCMCLPSPSPEKVPCGRPGCPDTLRSDFWPSVSLAAVLSLIFILVFSLLMSDAGGVSTVPFKSHAKSIRGKLVHLPILLSKQPPSTWWAVKQVLQVARGDESVVTVIAVATKDASQTLMCFTSSLMSLLSQQGHNLTKTLQLDESVTVSYHSRDAAMCKVSSISVLVCRGQEPYGIILGPQDTCAGGGHLYTMTLSIPGMKYNAAIHNEAFSIAAEVLRMLYKSGNIPKYYRRAGVPSVPVLEITADPYLEAGFIC